MKKNLIIIMSIMMFSSSANSLECGSASIRQHLNQAGNRVAKVKLLNRISGQLGKLRNNLKAMIDRLKNRGNQLSIEEVETLEAEVAIVQRASYIADGFYFEAEVTYVDPPDTLQAAVVDTQYTINEAKVYTADVVAEPAIVRDLNADFILALPVSDLKKSRAEQQIKNLGGAALPRQAGINYPRADIMNGVQIIDTRNLPEFDPDQDPTKPIFVGYHGTSYANEVLSEGYKTKRTDMNKSALHWGPGIYTTMDYDLAKEIGRGRVLEVWVLPEDIPKKLSVGKMPNNVKINDRVIFRHDTPQDKLNIAENDITVGPFVNPYQGYYRVANQAKIHPRLMEGGRVFFKSAEQ